MLSVCNFANEAQVDPIVSPGLVADHLHSENGAVNWTSTSTGQDLLAGPTTCGIPENHSAYWSPDIVNPAGQFVHTSSVHFYYAAGGKDTRFIANGRIQTPPVGLQMIKGDSHAKALQSASVVTWWCFSTGEHLGRTIPTGCTRTGESISMNLGFPSCWDGTGLKTTDVVLAINITLADGSVVKGCPRDHFIAIPVVQAQFVYPPAAYGGRLTSDHDPTLPAGYSSHADIIEAWDYSAIGQIVNCLNDPGQNIPGKASCGNVNIGTLQQMKLSATGVDYSYVAKPPA